jgi:oxygen-dependent protoporphyrinogen oxidase
MQIAVIGAGAAGLTAAYRLSQAGHRVSVFEQAAQVGGRMYSEHFGPGHHLDTGAGWLTTAYTRTLALFEEIGERDRLRPLKASGPAELIVDGKQYSGTGLPRSADGSTLVPATESAALREWLKGLTDYPPLGYRVDHDHQSAVEHLAGVSPAATKYVFAPMFEGLFAPLAEQSAEFLRSWIAASRVSYFQVEEGMDAPWKALSTRLNDVRLNARVDSLRASGRYVEVMATGTASRFDGAVIAVPPPQGRRFVDRSLDPRWISALKYEEISYAGQCRLYLAMPGAAPQRVHRRPVPMGLIASVEWQSGSDGAWGACPAGWQWALICANEADNADLIALNDGSLAQRLHQAARQYVPALPALETWAVQHIVRWAAAVPTMPPGHFRRIATYNRQPPVVFAGDWTHQACVEGAVRSGEAAATAFGLA